jgi:hypothetical protein
MGGREERGVTIRVAHYGLRSVLAGSVLAGSVLAGSVLAGSVLAGINRAAAASSRHPATAIIGALLSSRDQAGYVIEMI